MAEKYGLGIDLGTANLLVFLEKKGIIFNEPSVIAFDRESGQIVAAGKDAHKMLGKVHDKISVIKPLKSGVISDMKAAKALLTYVLQEVENLTEKDLTNTSCVMCCPSEVTKIERDIISELAMNMGISDVLIDEEIKAAALGANLDIFQSKGIMMVDIGGGTTDVGVLSFGDIVLSRTIRMAGNYIDTELAKLVKQNDKVEIGELTSENAKIELADLRKDAKLKVNRYAGRDIVRGIPKWVDISSTDVKQVLEPTYDEVVKLISAVLKDTPPELSADIFEHGIYLTGGGSLIKGVEEYISDRIKVPVKVVHNPLTCVAEGSKYLLKNRGDYLVNPLKL
ncbi:rod shape-determining protein [Candidatus Xianfuyuplasma coldseepsis]|uniref:Cell shape-determining protein MreB n=1 Tax=Candidatus Xianfuyuplasma coldseepsis TaxID=2782163 RepID=A0A7L7KPS2_9MOLU|nr:rod shape-determining protein [Xianfuyuplasma coldseepsis]QMS84565.1 rod shape-determining protein [Xianfuyuplasma coldseepsis]